MRPAPVDLPIIWRGSDWLAVLFNWKDGDGNPFDLTGWKFLAQTRRFDLNGTVTSATDGSTTVSLTSEVTRALKLGTEQWDCWFIDPSGIITPPLLAGKVEVKEKITTL
jgi:hypothetical protein